MGLSSADTLDILRRRFGAAVDVALSPAHTDPDAPPGSLSPEQAQSQPVAAQSDLYSLGVVMYEVLTGAHPYSESTSADQLVKRLTEPLLPLRERRPDLPQALEAVIRKATAQDSAAHYPDAPAFAAATSPLPRTPEEKTALSKGAAHLR